MKGDLRVVACTTYTLGLDGYGSHFTSDHLLQFSDKRNGLIIRGEELHDTRIKVNRQGKPHGNMRLCKNLISML
jgi:hypothetical protein